MISNSRLSGVICHDDKPDVIVSGSQKLGIEISNFFVVDGASPSSEQVQRRHRQAGVAKAQQLYQRAGGKNIDVTFSFNKEQPIQDVNGLARQLASLARHLENRVNGTIGRDVFEDIPELGFAYLRTRELQYSAEPDPEFPDGPPDASAGFTAFKTYRNRREARALREGIYKPLQSPATWKTQQLHSWGLMSADALTEIIREKEAKAQHYTTCDAYWLLIVVDFIDSAQEQEIRIEGFTVGSDVFQRIILYKPQFEQMVEITPHPATAR